MNRWDHYAHNSKILVKEGDIVERGQTIALMGDTGVNVANPKAGDAHSHQDTWKEDPAKVGWNAYTKGMTRAQVLARYEDAMSLYDFKAGIPCHNTHYGWRWLDKINSAGQLHPGWDLNEGSGDSDIGKPVRAIHYGKVVKVIMNASGWGHHLFIQRLNKPKAMDPIKVRMLAVLNKSPWIEQSHLDKIRSQIASFSDGKIDLEIVRKDTQYEDIPHEYSGMTGMSLDWIEKTLVPTAQGFRVLLLHVPLEQWPPNVGSRGWRTDDNGGRLTELQATTSPGETESRSIGILDFAFVNRIIHELCHEFEAISGFSGVLHDYAYNRKDIKGFFNLLNYELIAKKFSTKGEHMKIVEDPNGTTYLVGDLGKIGIASPEAMSLLRKIESRTDKADTSNIVDKGIIDQGLIIDFKKGV